MRILIVEDEKRLAATLQDLLEMDGYTADVSYDGESGLDNALTAIYDVILLDVMLPKLDGISVCQRIREHSNVPIIMLTAKGEDMDKILGLEYGADDYMTKPFNILEVKARVKALLRRSAATKRQQEQDKRLTSGGLTIDPEARAAWKNDQPVELTAREFDLLELLMKHPNRVYSREQLLNQVWGYEYTGEYRTVDVHIRRLREKVEGVSDQWALKTVWGVGYKFEVRQ